MANIPVSFKIFQILQGSEFFSKSKIIEDLVRQGHSQFEVDAVIVLMKEGGFLSSMRVGFGTVITEIISLRPERHDELMACLICGEI